MFEDDEILIQESSHIRECIIPTGSVKFVSLNLGPGENGIVVNCEPIFEEKIEEHIEGKRSAFLLNVKIVPIIMRKRLLYEQYRAS